MLLENCHALRRRIVIVVCTLPLESGCKTIEKWRLERKSLELFRNFRGRVSPTLGANDKLPQGRATARQMDSGVNVNPTSSVFLDAINSLHEGVVSPEQRSYPDLPIVSGDETDGVVVVRQKQAKESLSVNDLSINESILNEDSPHSLDQPEHWMWQFVI
jgi:hypothetical protein